jgi:hypothetical protein
VPTRACHAADPSATGSILDPATAAEGSDPIGSFAPAPSFNFVFLSTEKKYMPMEINHASLGTKFVSQSN